MACDTTAVVKTTDHTSQCRNDCFVDTYVRSHFYATYSQTPTASLGPPVSNPFSNGGTVKLGVAKNVGSELPTNLRQTPNQLQFAQKRCEHPEPLRMYHVFKVTLLSHVNVILMCSKRVCPNRVNSVAAFSRMATARSNATCAASCSCRAH